MPAHGPLVRPSRNPRLSCPVRLRPPPLSPLPTIMLLATRSPRTALLRRRGYQPSRRNVALAPVELDRPPIQSVSSVVHAPEEGPPIPWHYPDGPEAHRRAERRSPAAVFGRKKMPAISLPSELENKMERLWGGEWCLSAKRRVDMDRPVLTSVFDPVFHSCFPLNDPFSTGSLRFQPRMSRPPAQPGSSSSTPPPTNSSSTALRTPPGSPRTRFSRSLTTRPPRAPSQRNSAASRLTSPSSR